MNSRISIRVCENRPDMVGENRPEMIRVSNLIFHMPNTIKVFAKIISYITTFKVYAADNLAYPSESSVNIHSLYHYAEQAPI